MIQPKQTGSEESDRERLLELAAQVCDGRAKEAGHRELEGLLEASGDARRLWRRYANLHVALGNCCGAGGKKALPAEKGRVNRNEPVEDKIVKFPASSHRWLHALGVAAAAALVVLGIVGVSVFRPSGSPVADENRGERAPADLVSPGGEPSAGSRADLGEGEDARVADSAPVDSTPPPKPGDEALLVNLIGAKWTEGFTPLVTNTWLRAGEPILLRDGAARLKLRSGAVVSLQGPAEFEVLEGNQARMKEGRLVARVPSTASGFTLQTPVANVVDLGTAFGVHAKHSGDVAVQVFEGDVEVYPKGSALDGREIFARRVRAGEALSLSNDLETMEWSEIAPLGLNRLRSINSGIVSYSGKILLESEEPQQRLDRNERDSQLLVIVEKSLVLEEALTVNFSRAGRYVGPSDGKAATLLQGTKLRSYLLQFNPVGKPEKGIGIKASITFDQPIAGVVADLASLRNSDGIFGRYPKAYLGTGTRTIDGPSSGVRRFKKDGRRANGDLVQISGDRHTLRVDWVASVGIDQVRVLVFDENF